MGRWLGVGTIEIAFAKVKHDFVERALFPLFGLRQPEIPAFGIERGALSAQILLTTYLHELIHDPHSCGCEANTSGELSRPRASLSQLPCREPWLYRDREGGRRCNAT